LNENFKKLKKGLKYLLKNIQVYEIIPIEVFVDMKNLKKIVEIALITMSENLVLLNVYFQIYLKGENIDLGQ
jgi:hypothetical protein